MSIISDFTSISGIDWTEIHPDENNDWINQRDQNYDKFDAMDGEVFINKAIGVSTNRDAWVYGYNRDNMIKNIYDWLSKCYNYTVTKTFNPTQVCIGNSGQFQICYQNSGAGLTSVDIWDTIPSCLSVTGISYTGLTPSQTGGPINVTGVLRRLIQVLTVVSQLHLMHCKCHRVLKMVIL